MEEPHLVMAFLLTESRESTDHSMAEDREGACVPPPSLSLSLQSLQNLVP